MLLRKAHLSLSQLFRNKVLLYKVVHKKCSWFTNYFSIGLSDGPKIFSGRIVFLSLFLWALMMYQFYSASIVGSLLAPPARFIKNLRDLADSNLQVEFEETPYAHDYFKVG